MAKSIMIQGTMSNAGKSILVGGLCRVLVQDGYKVAPFKSQNMALNSYITREGLEMGRAQVMQAEAAKIEPSVDMNPILLKPTNDTGSQVIVNGEVVGVLSAADYFKRKKDYVPSILEAYQRLSKENDIIVIEGAGSPAEINLKKDDIVNMGLAEMVDAPVLLVGDIDRGGVFAQLVGTLMLLEEKERQRVKGTIINKFRGDVEILKPGLEMLWEKVGIPVQGVIPYFHLDIDDEDSLTERFDKNTAPGLIDIVVIRLPRISNFTDFAPLESLEGVSLRYVDKPGKFGNPDGVIIPGSKNTIQDLLWMRQSGLETKVIRHHNENKLVFGICGGYQMMGLDIYDPEGVEQKGKIQGMGLLKMHTVFAPEKTRRRVKGRFGKVEGLLESLSHIDLEGYEIHMGASELEGSQKSLIELEGKRHDGVGESFAYGCYIHGIFDKSEVSQSFVRALALQKGCDPEFLHTIDHHTYKEQQYDQLAQIIRSSLDMEAIYDIIEGGKGI
ncbi:adenosylcobyric acid synthase [Aequitasia blattaphilus]|uniref:Cobyric acid synthase n=1 Tax=Aequitasia blattaphilus TaxID=2949332 RepID=A0ABT1E8L2_9FIRM|nr:cobyric acid synthase [Aequitasia blattaphilus]MCP1102164.1 cobyric acid synthase [Aequitasia blattaphilus]MCR8614804.1 cobyric acid synthase [Aequitasia blattaphilus]